ncbi:MAG: hypothetical protein GF347_01265 [Candidatus Moranbacteria bacterium]|nr:hypothetical protein [Candidatus Moranbacteria bacterium]
MFISFYIKYITMKNILSTSFLVFCFLPLYFLKIDLADYGSLNLIDCLILFYLSIFSIYLTDKLKRADFYSFVGRNKNVLLIIFFICCFLLLSFYVNSDKNNSLKSLGVLKSYYFLPILFAIMLVYLIKQRIVRLKKIFKAYLISSIVIVIISLFFILEKNLTYDYRLSSIFSSPNYLAIYISPAILLLLSMVKQKKVKQSKRFLLFLLISLYLIVILFTKCQGAIISVFLLSLFITLPDEKKIKFLLKNNKVKKLFLLFFIFANILIIFGLKPLTDYLDYDPYLNRSSLDSRLVIYEISRDIAFKNPVWGIGPANFQNVYLLNQSSYRPYPQWAVPHAHNNILVLLLESGIAGAALFLSLIYLWLAKMNKQAFKSKSYMLPACLIIFYFLIHGLIDATIWKNDYALMFWFFLIRGTME